MIKFYLFIILFIAFASYSASVYTIGTEEQKSIASEDAIKGKLIFQKYNCIACHQIYGLGGYLGPDLTTAISNKNKGEDFARALLKTGSQRMPDHHFSNEEIDALIAYLTYINSTTDTTEKSYLKLQ